MKFQVFRNAFSSSIRVCSCSRFTPAVISFTIRGLTIRVHPNTAVFEGTPNELRAQSKLVMELRRLSALK